MGALDVRRHLQEECEWDDLRMLIFDEAVKYLVEVERMKKEAAQLAVTDAIMAVFEPDSMPSFDNGDGEPAQIGCLVSSLVSCGVDEEIAEECGRQLAGVIRVWRNGPEQRDARSNAFTELRRWRA